jgi:hypothetical protein
LKHDLAMPQSDTSKHSFAIRVAFTHNQVLLTITAIILTIIVIVNIAAYCRIQHHHSHLITVLVVAIGSNCSDRQLVILFIVRPPFDPLPSSALLPSHHSIYYIIDIVLILMYIFALSRPQRLRRLVDIPGIEEPQAVELRDKMG